MSESERLDIDQADAGRLRDNSKIAVVLREDLAVWQKLNVTSFLISGVATANPAAMGEPYQDGSGNQYSSMFGQPVMVYAAAADELRRAFDRATSRGLQSAIFTAELFATGNDADNRSAVQRVAYHDLDVVGFAFLAQRRIADKVLKGVRLHG